MKHKDLTTKDTKSTKEITLEREKANRIGSSALLLRGRKLPWVKFWAYAERFNEGDTPQQNALGRLFAAGLPKDVQIKPNEPEDLKKLAFWSATGSGKTLLMHVNILQYQHYQKLNGRGSDINRTILVTMRGR